MEEAFKYRKLHMLMMSIQSHKEIVGAENVVSDIARSLMVRSSMVGTTRLHDYAYTMVVSYILQGSIWLSAADWEFNSVN
jgi:hypothetical protein